MRVKGSILAPWIKAIRADKHADYNKWLTEEDWRIVSGTVLSSSWYAFETYQRCCLAVCRALGGATPEMLSGWGADYSESVIKSMYGRHIVDGQPLVSLQKHLSVVKLFFDFGNIYAEAASDSRIRVIVKGFPPDFVELHDLLRGWYGKVLEMAGATGVKSRCITSSELDDTNVCIEFWW